VTSSVACVVARMIPWSKGSTSDVRFCGRSFVCLTLCILRQLTGEKVTNKHTGIVYLSLKFIYLFIYRAAMFRLFPSHQQGACYMVQQKKQSVYFPRYS
jgi:hypothetical protein